MTATTPPLAITAAVADAIAALKREADRQMGCPYELWIVRLNLEAKSLASAMTDAERDAFTARAAAEGLMDPQADAAWLLEPDDEHCAHGLDPHCCPCGCGDIETD
jgi:anti-sigma-K factor RskA